MESGDNMIVKSLSVPIGLEELMEGLTKEVLLKRPTDVYAFASEYFNKLLRMREKGCYKGEPTIVTRFRLLFSFKVIHQNRYEQ